MHGHDKGKQGRGYNLFRVSIKFITTLSSKYVSRKYNDVHYL